MLFTVYNSAILGENQSENINQASIETSILKSVKIDNIYVEVFDSRVVISSIISYKLDEKNNDIVSLNTLANRNNQLDKINKINKTLKSKGMIWRAGETNISSLPYHIKKSWFGDTYFYGFDYYKSGFYELPFKEENGTTKKAYSTTDCMVERFDY